MKFEVTTTQAAEFAPSMHFADAATPEEAGGPGALVVVIGPTIVRIPASDPLVVELVDRIGAELSGKQNVRAVAEVAAVEALK